MQLLMHNLANSLARLSLRSRALSRPVIRVDCKSSGHSHAESYQLPSVLCDSPYHSIPASVNQLGTKMLWKRGSYLSEASQAMIDNDRRLGCSKIFKKLRVVAAVADYRTTHRFPFLEYV
jgi:hypothetical protein